MNELDQVCVFVMSCDKTSDVAIHFVHAFSIYWPDCPFKIFVGSNSGNLEIKDIKGKFLKSNTSNWRSESLDQISQIRNLHPEITHIILFLDDFIIRKKIDTNKLINLVKGSLGGKIKYLRFKKIEEGLINSFLKKLKRKIFLGDQKCIPIRRNHPYYSSLQVALWDIDYLYELINKAENIWHFEHLNTGTSHWSVLNSVIKYKHIVEKGQWEIYSRKYCEKSIGFFNVGEREFRKLGFFSYMKFVFRKLIFLIFGYSIYNFKKIVLKLK